MTKYQHHVFENQFKKSISTISQIVARTRSELGVSNLASYCTESNRTSNNGTPYYNRTECINSINNQINKVSKADTVNNINRTSEIIKTYNAQSNLTYFDSSVRTILYTNQLADSSFLGFYVHNSNLYFAVDLNAYKKPNRLGYDIFIFSISKKNDTVTGFQDKIPTNTSDSDATDYANTLADNPNRDVYELWHGIPCNLESTRSSNGIGCAYFALRNKCPYDNTKTYWECLK